MLKNVATKLLVYCWTAADGTPKTGDAANLTAYVSLDWDTSPDAIADTSATELSNTNAKGFYIFDLAQGETNGDYNAYFCKSSTAGVVCMCVPCFVHTLPTTGVLAPTVAARTLDVSAGGEAGVDWANVGSPTTALDLNGTTIKTTQKVDVETIKTQTVTCSAGVTVSPFVGSTGAAINGTNANTLSGHDPGATLGTSTLTQTQVTGGAYALNSASFAFNSALDFTTTQKAATLARVTLTDTATAVTGISTGGITAASIADGAIDRATFAADTGLQTVRSSTATGGSITTVTLDASASSVDNFYNGMVIYLTGGTGAGQARVISDYDGTTKIATIMDDGNPFSTAPVNGTTFAVLPQIGFLHDDFVSGTGDISAIQVSPAGYVLSDVRRIVNQTVTCAAGVTVLASVGTASTDTAQTGDSYARLGAPAGASVSADIAAVAADNPNRPTRGVQLDDLVFTMVDATDFNTPETGITVSAAISKDGGAFNACSNSVSEISAGFYKITLTATEMTANSVALKFTGTGCAQRNFAFRTQPT